MKKSAFAIILAFLFVARAQAFVRLHATDQTGPPVVTFSGSTVQVSGVTPGGTVVFYGVAMLQINYSSAIGRFKTALTDDDQDGSVTYDIGQTIPPTSLWVVVDVTSGRYAIAGPARTVFAEADLQTTPYTRNAVTGAVDTFVAAYPTVEMVYILPGTGVWSLHSVAGGPVDHGSDSASTTVSIADAAPLVPQSTGQLTQFDAAGILITFDDSNFDVVITQLLAGAP